MTKINKPTVKFDYTLPPQLANATPQEIRQFQAYINGKKSLGLFSKYGDTTELEAVLAAYERKIGLKTNDCDKEDT